MLIHAISLDGEEVALRQATAPTSTLPVLVLLDDAPTIPEFLPDETDFQFEDPTEENVRTAIEQRVREALRRGPSADPILDLVESIQDAVIVIDRQRAVVYLNASATALLQRLTGRTGPFVGEPLGIAFPPALSAPTGSAVHDALVHAAASRIEDPERHRGIALDIAIFPHPQGVTLLVRDATQRRDVEAELVETRLSLARAEARLRARDEASA